MTRKRVTVSILLAVLIHAAVLLLAQLFLRLAPDRTPEYSGPMVVTLEEFPESRVLERVQERQVQPQPQAPEPEPRPQASVQPRTQPAPAQPTAKPRAQEPPAQRVPVQPSPVQTPPAQPSSAQTPPRGSRQVVPAEPLGTLPPVAPEETTPYQPQTFSQPLQDQGPVRAASTQPDKTPLLDTSRLDSAIARPDSGPSSAAGPALASPGSPGASQSTVEGFQIQWHNPSEGRQVLQSAQPQLPAWVSNEGLRLQVAVAFVLQPSGFLRDIRIAASSGYSDVDTAVVSALRRWRFSASPGAPDVGGEVTYRIIPR